MVASLIICLTDVTFVIFTNLAFKYNFFMAKDFNIVHNLINTDVIILLLRENINGK